MTAPLSFSLLLLTFLLLLLSLTLAGMLLVVVVHIINDITAIRALKISIRKKNVSLSQFFHSLLVISGFHYAPRFLNIYAKKKGKSEADFLINAWCGEKKIPTERLIFIELSREVAQLFISSFFCTVEGQLKFSTKLWRLPKP